MSSPHDPFPSVLTVVLALVGTIPASAQSRKLDRVFREVGQKPVGSGAQYGVIVRAESGYGPWFRTQLVKEGVEILSDHPLIDGMTLDLTAAEIDRFCSNAAAVSTLLGNPGWEPSRADGTGMTVAFIDSGIEPSKAFHGRIKAFYDYTNRKGNSKRPYDDYGHGTHVAGLIGGLQTAEDYESPGVAPGIDFVVFKVLNDDGSGRTSDVTTGAVALVRQQAGEKLTPNLAKALLKFTAIPPRDDDGEPYDRVTEGTGGLSVGGARTIVPALDFAVTDTGQPWVPTLPLCPGVQQRAAAAVPSCSTSIGGQHHVWARNIVWGNSIVWGNTVYYNLPTWNLLNPGLGRHAAWHQQLCGATTSC